MNRGLDAKPGFQRVIEVADGNARHGAALSAMIAAYALLISVQTPRPKTPGSNVERIPCMVVQPGKNRLPKSPKRVLVLFEPTLTPGSPTLNAISEAPPPDGRTERHLAMCQEMAEIGMQLVRAVAQKALRDWTEAVPEAEAKAAKKPDPALTFSRLTGAVRQAIALEARIANPPQTQARRGREKKFDPRRATLKRLIHETTERSPDRNDLRKGAERTIEDHLADDFYDNTPMPDLFQIICKEAGIEPSERALSDEMLDIAFPGPWPPPRPPKPRPTFLVDIPLKVPIPP